MDMPRLALALVLLAFPVVARADAIDGPPACPPGARGQSSHSGQWCIPAACASDADCIEVGGSCRAWRVCTRHAQIPPGGLGAFRDPPPPPAEIDVAVGSCAPGAACRGDEEPPPPTAGTLVAGAPTCTEATFCVPVALPSLPSAPSASPSPSPSPSASPSTSPSASVSTSASCTCGVGASRPPALALGMLVLAAAITRRRR